MNERLPSEGEIRALDREDFNLLLQSTADSEEPPSRALLVPLLNEAARRQVWYDRPMVILYPGSGTRTVGLAIDGKDDRLEVDSWTEFERRIIRTMLSYTLELFELDNTQRARERKRRDR